ncbi:Caleosin related protein-domain-containing protein [Daldinia sp. FL1419]|nr:Caleosin related protein-domain-containing protein [Daldinia sp. FL1419]
MKRSCEGRKSAGEHAEHFQRLRSRRLSIRGREEPKSPETIHGQLSQEPPEIVLPQQVIAGPGRRRVSAPGEMHSGIHDPHDIRGHRAPQRERVKVNELVSVLEKSERRHLVKDTAPPPVRAIPWDLPKRTPPDHDSTVAATYEPAHILRQNAEYFDSDQDGIIWLKDTYTGCRKLGWGIAYSCLTAFSLHSILSYPTSHGYIPDPLLRIRYESNRNGENSHSNTSYNEKGHTRQNNICENILAKYDSGNKGGMDAWDIIRFWRDQRSKSTFYGWSLTVLDWLTLCLALHDSDGIVRSDDIRTAFDGSILFKRAEEHQQKNETHHKEMETITRNGNRRNGRKQSDPVKLAVAIVVGFAVFTWIVLGLVRNPPGWRKYWWEKDEVPQEPSLTDPGLVDDW